MTEAWLCGRNARHLVVCLALAAGVVLTADPSRAGVVEVQAVRADALPAQTRTTAQDADDLGEFLDVLVRSADMRRRYTDSHIRVSDAAGTTTLVPSADYDDFPIESLDWNYIVPGSFEPGRHPEYLHLLVNPTADDIWRVDWIVATYDGNHEGGDGLGELVSLDGPEGALLFRRSDDDRWTLIADMRNPPDTPFVRGPVSAGR